MTRREIVRNIKLYILITAILLSFGIAMDFTEREDVYVYRHSIRVEPIQEKGESEIIAQVAPKPIQALERHDRPARISDSGAKAQVMSTDTPLPRPMMDELYSACESYAVPLSLALAVIEQESGFNLQAVSSAGCYGLMQLDPDYFPAGLTPKENIRHGVRYLGELLATHDSAEAAVTAYFYGPSDRVQSWYSDEVLARAERWK